jgi:hypothetical protein
VTAPYVPPPFELGSATEKKLTELVESQIPQERQQKVDNADFQDFT